jgi:hypothetical protein
MKPPAKPPLFLERGNYRQRRLGDAARLLPLLGVVLVLIPLMWGDAGDAPQSGRWIYIFAIWAGLIGLAAVLAHRLRDPASPPPPQDPPR